MARVDLDPVLAYRGFMIFFCDLHFRTDVFPEACMKLLTALTTAKALPLALTAAPFGRPPQRSA